MTRCGPPLEGACVGALGGVVCVWCVAFPQGMAVRDVGSIPLGLVRCSSIAGGGGPLDADGVS